MFDVKIPCTIWFVEKSYGRLSPSVNVSLSRIPQHQLPKRSRKAFVDSSHNTNVNFTSSSIRASIFAASHPSNFSWPDLPEAEPSLRNLVRVLKIQSQVQSVTPFVSPNKLLKCLDARLFLNPSAPAKRIVPDRPAGGILPRQNIW